MNTRLLVWSLAFAGALLLGACDRLTRPWDTDLELSYLGDESGHVKLASVSTGTRVIASATRVSIRETENPEVTELDVDETHFVRGTPDVVYTGRIVFECSTKEEVCHRIRVAPTSGTRPRDIFREWPLRINGPPVHPKLPPPG